MQILRGLHSTDFRPLAVTIGNFDGVHLGHQAMLQELRETARARGLQTAVLTFEPHPREFFAPQQAPVRLTSLREKLEMFGALGMDRVYVCRFDSVFAQMTAEAFIRALHEKLRAKYVLIGDDFRFGSGRGGDFALMQQAGVQHGFEVKAMHSVLFDGVRVSSTAIRNALAEGKLDIARDYLRRPYSISGRVVHGDAMGRKLGYPTANIQMKHNLPPLKGVYVVQVQSRHGAAEPTGAGATALHLLPQSADFVTHVSEVHSDGLGVLQGVASLGVRPTVHHDARHVLEVHLFEFAQQIYGRHLRVEFLYKLRDEMKFDGLEALTRQIASDVNNAKQWFINHE